jgi:hypothetical protein
MALQPDLDADNIDEKGHTSEQAKAQHPTLDLDRPAASQETPSVSGAGEKDTGDVMVLAQTPEEVRAQILNPAGAPGDEHDLEKQLAASAARQALKGDDDEPAGDDGDDDDADGGDADAGSTGGAEPTDQA